MVGLEWDWEADVLENLNRFSGIDLRLVLGMPKNPLVGDRVLYLLRGGPAAAQRLKERLSAQAQVGEATKQLASHPYVVNLDSITLGGPSQMVEVRITDLLGSLCFQRGQREYLQSDTLLPQDEWEVRWALGAIFLADQRIMVYADLRHSRVALLFTESFFDAREQEPQRKPAGRLLERLQGALTLRNRYSQREDYRWVKIVNMCGGPQWVAVMRSDGRLSLEEIPYPD